MRTIAHYLASRVFHMGLGLLTSVGRARLLPPELFGLWTLLKTLPTYAAHSHLGASSAMRFLIPVHRSRGEEQQLAAVQDTAFAGGLLSTLPLLVVALVAAAWPGFSGELRVALLLLGAVALVGFIRHHAASRLRGHQRFGPIVRGGYVHAILLLALTIGLVLALGFPGLFWALLLADGALLCYLWLALPARPRLRLDPALWRRLVGFGLPIVLIDVMVSLLVTADRWVVGATLGAAPLGHYGIAVLALGALSQLPVTAREVLEPMAMHSLDGQSSARTLERFLLAPLLDTAFLVPLVIGPLYLLVPSALALVLPVYAAGAAPTQVMLLAFYFLALGFPARTILVAFGEQRRYALLLPLLLAAAVGLDLLAVRAGLGLTGVAAASGLAFALLLTLQLILIGLRVPSRGPRWTSSLIGALLPFPLLVGLLELAGHSPAIVGAAWLDASIKGLLLAACWLALHAAARRRWPLLSPLPRPWRRG